MRTMAASSRIITHAPKLLRLALAVLLLSVSPVRPRAQEAALLTAEQLRQPLRALAFTFDEGALDALPSRLRSFAGPSGFALRLSGDPQGAEGALVELYRTDIKLIGRLRFRPARLDVQVFRTSHRVPAEAVDQGVGALAAALAAVPGQRLKQQTFKRGDEFAGREPSVSAVHGADGSIAESALGAIKQSLVDFANARGFAIRLSRNTPDPRSVTFQMFRNDMQFLGGFVLEFGTFGIGVYRSGDGTVAQADIDAAFDALSATLERASGVPFVGKK